MSSPSVPGFLNDLRAYGTFDANACLNCGSCTVVCDLSDHQTTFPRRTMQRALLGLKGSVQADLTPWLCHDCGDCAITCPRQAEPRESMVTLRRYLAGAYDVTGISSRILRSRLWHIVSLIMAAALVFALVGVYHLWYAELPFSDFVETEMGLEHMFPLMEYFTITVCLLPVLLLISSAWRMIWLTMKGSGIRAGVYLAQLKTMAVHMVSHQNIRKCAQAATTIWRRHWMLGLAFSIMFIIKVGFLTWFQTDEILPVYHPQRWLGYFVAAVFLGVSINILLERLQHREDRHVFSELSDLTLPIMLVLVAVSGLAVHISRYLEWTMTCHYSYAAHVAISVSFLLVELPFGKLSHVMYRPLALFLDAVRERAKVLEESTAVPQPPEELINQGTQPV